MLRWSKQRDNDRYKDHLDGHWTTTSFYTAHTAYAVYIAYTALLAYAVFIVAFSSYIYLLLLKLYGNMALWVLDYIRIKSYNWLLLSVSHFPEVGSGHRFRIFS